MPACRRPSPPARPRQQRGAILLVTVVTLVVGLAAILVGSLSSSAIQIERDRKTEAALAEAKEALVGSAVADDNMPGRLPCPDTNDDGLAESPTGNCPSYIGRLPWKTLRLPDLRDGSGERLWYALSPAFRAQPLNSNTKGTLNIYNADGTSLQTQAGYSAIAVIFSPNGPIGSQVRNTVNQQNNAANYLDNAYSWNNASSAGPFVAGTKSATFNDQLIFITTKDLIPLVEQRVADTVKKALTDYYSVNHYYPWADQLAYGADNYAANAGLNRGWLPRDASTSGTPNWGAGSFPQWFFDNQWYTLIYYSVAEDYTADPYHCDSCDNHTLSVDGTNGVRALFFMPGTPIGTLTRSPDRLSDYLEDPQNKDDSNDLYVTPTSQATDRDRLYWLSSSSIWKP